MDVLLFLAAPFAMAVLLVGIHAYLGLHVLEREVIFVDISLSQVAALGAALSLFVVTEESDTVSDMVATVFSLSLCLIVALILAYLRHFEKKISQEALIGMTYALASGGLILVMDRVPHGMEHLKEALVGNILFVTWSQVLQIAIVYALIGVIHYTYRRQFWAASQKKMSSFYWDFLFYLLFGVVITLSTKHAGVLVVFSILVAPAALACLWIQGVKQRLALAWASGLFGILVAFLASYYWDLPAGAGIVVTLTAGFFISLAASKIGARAN